MSARKPPANHAKRLAPLAAALPLGRVDVKVCAVDNVASGLEPVIRKELRRTVAR